MLRRFQIIPYTKMARARPRGRRARREITRCGRI